MSLLGPDIPLSTRNSIFRQRHLISDHSPILIQLIARPTANLQKAPWKLNAFWLNLIPSHEGLLEAIREYWESNADHPDLNTAWDAFKAYMRGSLIKEVTNIKTKTRAQGEQAEQLVRRLETKFTDDPSDSNREAWLAAQEAVIQITKLAADKKRFFNRLVYYEKGEQTGLLLARIVNSSQTSPTNGALRTKQGRMVNTPDLIMQELVDYYSDLYRSRAGYTETEL